MLMLELHIKIISYVTASLVIQSKLIHNSRITENKKEKKLFSVLFTINHVLTEYEVKLNLLLLQEVM